MIRKKINKKLALLSLCLIMVMLWLLFLNFSFNKPSGIYRSFLFERMHDGYQGYIVMSEGKVFSVNLGRDPAEDLVERVGEYRSIDTIYEMTVASINNNDNPSYFFSVTLFGIKWENAGWLEGEPLNISEGQRVLNPLKRSRIRQLTDSLP